MADIDPKDIGLAIKDIVVGVGTVAAGVTGGPAAAGGVQQAGGALDRILGMAGAGPTRAQQFDRADYAARQRSVPSAPTRTPESPRSLPSQRTPIPTAGTHDEPLADARLSRLGDAQIALDHLRALGWSEEVAYRILGGPERGRVQRAEAEPSVQAAVQADETERWKQTLALYSQQSKQRSKANGGLG